MILSALFATVILVLFIAYRHDKRVNDEMERSEKEIEELERDIYQQTLRAFSRYHFNESEFRDPPNIKLAASE